MVPYVLGHTCYMCLLIHAVYCSSFLIFYFAFFWFGVRVDICISISRPHAGQTWTFWGTIQDCHIIVRDCHVIVGHCIFVIVPVACGKHDKYHVWVNDRAYDWVRITGVGRVGVREIKMASRYPSSSLPSRHYTHSWGEEAIWRDNYTRRILSSHLHTSNYPLELTTPPQTSLKAETLL